MKNAIWQMENEMGGQRLMKSEKKRSNSLDECGRKEDLVTYLYDEANATERASFERHLDDCDSCRSGLTVFGRVRLDLSAWQLGLAPRSEIVLRRSMLELLRELIGMFPVWVRGAGFIGAAAAMLVVSLSITGMSVSLKDGDFAVNFGRTGIETPANQAVSSEEVGRMIQNAVAQEREKMEELYTAQLASFKDQLDADHQAKLQAARADHQAQIRSAQAALQQEMRRLNRQNASGGIRAFFARDDSIDPWGDGR
jgi:Putative zinc-finger